MGYWLMMRKHNKEDMEEEGVGRNYKSIVVSKDPEDQKEEKEEETKGFNVYSSWRNRKMIHALCPGSEIRSIQNIERGLERLFDVMQNMDKLQKGTTMLWLPCG
ncbi:hypothetical protein MKW92_038134 [Papaver armeniacum]|nr:hypothetical protein MKW92_038134 [Papaver armeniacum]